ncbi:unnamed protein product [Cuscuta epithymum]|uniref:Uncharacterized protein n=2 Tax=Cuscuta epithymum TaxID=186058 RepID=A0AAV0F702_9ASTE|nr:unnamed protein product [Cuscuta epithymum]
MLTLLQSPAFTCPFRLLPSQSRKPTTAKASNTHSWKADCKSSNISSGDDEEDGFGGRKGVGKDYDRDPEFGEILGSLIVDPEKAKSKIDERFRKKRNNVLQSKTGSPIPMAVKFNQFDFTNSYIWFEFYNSPLEKDVSLICNTIRSWHIIGRLGACNSMNMQG